MLDPHDACVATRTPASANAEIVRSAITLGRPRPYSGPERRAFGASALALALMLDEVDYGLVLLGEYGQVIHLNHLARVALESDAHPLELHGRQLQARQATDQEALVDAMAGAAGRGRRCLLKLGTAGRSTMVSVVPLGHPGHGDVTIAIIFGKRGVCEELSVQAFARVHRLTGAETKVLAALCHGARVRDVADANGVETSTVRSQISSIRSKTGADSIAALVRQVAVLPPLVSALRRC